MGCILASWSLLGWILASWCFLGWILVSGLDSGLLELPGLDSGVQGVHVIEQLTDRVSSEKPSGLDSGLLGWILVSWCFLGWILVARGVHIIEQL